MNLLKILVILVVGSIFITSCGQQEGQEEQHHPEMPGQMGQPTDIEVSDEELDKFIDAMQEVQVVSMGAQEEFIQEIEDKGMKLERFQEIQMDQQQQQQGQPGQADATDQEMEQFLNIMEAMQEIEIGIQEEMEDAIESAGLSIERYQEIANAAQHDEELLQKLESRLDNAIQQQPAPQ